MNSDVHFMRLALLEAEKAFKIGEIPVGAVLVMNGSAVVQAHNDKEHAQDPTAHAEMIVIRQGAAQQRDWRLDSATLYVTKEPCVMCAGAMVNARLGRLVYGCADERFGAVNSRFQLLHDPGLNHQVRVMSGILQDECSALLKTFFQSRR